MKRYASLAALAGLLVWAGTVLAQEAVTIKLKELGKGETAEVEKTETVTLAKKTTDAKGKESNENFTLTTTTAFKETILERDGNKPPTKLEREYTKAQVKVGGMGDDLPYSGKTVVIEKKGDKYTFTIKGGAELKGPAAQSLDQEFNNKSADSADLEKLLLPKGAVKPNDEWKLDMAAILKGMKDESMDADVAKATGTGKLVKVYQKDGKPFGEMRFTMTVPLKSAGKGDEKVTFKEGGKTTFDVSMDACIDGTLNTGQSKAKMQLSGSGPAAKPEGATVAISITLETQETRKELPKK
jgi:hypothetical protein